MAAQVIIKRQANGYAGAISDFQPGKPMIPFEALSYDEREHKLAGRFSFTPARGSAVAVTVAFKVSADTLLGNTTVRVGATTVQFIYDLKKQPDSGDLSLPGSPEIEDYNKIKAEKDADAKIKRIDEFVQKYPDSRRNPLVLQEGALLGKQMNDMEMMAKYGEKCLAVWPDNYVLLTEMASAYVQRRSPDKAEEEALNAIELIRKAEKPALVSDDQWPKAKDNILSLNYSTLGFVHVHRAQSTNDQVKKKEECDKGLVFFRQVLGITPSDDFSLYGTGVLYAFLDDYPNAEVNFARASVIAGQVGAISRSLLEQLYKAHHNGSLDGLDQVLEKARKDLGISR